VDIKLKLYHGRFEATMNGDLLWTVTGWRSGIASQLADYLNRWYGVERGPALEYVPDLQLRQAEAAARDLGGVMEDPGPRFFAPMPEGAEP